MTSLAEGFGARGTLDRVARIARAVADGHLDDGERREILGRVSEAEARLSALRGSLR